MNIEHHFSWIPIVAILASSTCIAACADDAKPIADDDDTGAGPGAATGVGGTTSAGGSDGGGGFGGTGAAGGNGGGGGAAGCSDIPQFIANGGQDIAIAQGPNGQVHAAFHGGGALPGLHYALRIDETYWADVKIVDQGFAAEEIDIVVDAADGIHVSYRIPDEGLGYAHKPIDGPWMTSVIDTYTGNQYNAVGRYSSLGIDSTGTVHITYVGPDASGRLKHAELAPGGAWVTETVDPAGDTGVDTALVIDSADGLHVSYGDDGNNTLNYAYRPAGGAWVTSVVDVNGLWFGALTLDDAGGLHISYPEVAVPPFDLKHAYKPAGGTWQIATVPGGEDTELGAANAVDAAGRVHVLHAASGGEQVRYSVREIDGTWTTEVLPGAEVYLGDFDLVLDPDGSSHVALAPFAGAQYLHLCPR